MRIAIISDIHGNLEALKTTLADIKKKNVDKIFCLGDTVAKGVHPEECVNLVRENCEIVLRGNCDRHFGKTYENMDGFPELEKKRLIKNQSLLSKESRDYIFNLPFSFEFYMSGSLVRLFHATPWADNVAIVNEDKMEDKLKLFYPSEYTETDKVADIAIYAHVHHPYLDKLYCKTLINVGSVGNSFDVIRNPEKDSNVMETTRSNYLIIEGDYGSKEYTSDISFQFVRVPYDIDKELMHQEDNIELENYKYELKNGMYRNMERIKDHFRGLGIDVEKF